MSLQSMCPTHLKPPSVLELPFGVTCFWTNAVINKIVQCLLKMTGSLMFAEKTFS